MLSPEVWNFEAPSGLTTHSIKAVSKYNSLIRSQFFNHRVSLTIPDTHEVPAALRNILTEDSDFYFVKNLRAVELVEDQFIHYFVEKGGATLLSIGTKLDQDDCVALTPFGKLFFSLKRDTFQRLGVRGKPSFFSNKIPDKYLLPLLLYNGDAEIEEYENETTLLYKRDMVKRCCSRLREMKDFCFDVIFAWEPPSDKICPSSLAKYFTEKGYQVKTCSLKFTHRRDYNVRMPLLEDINDGDVVTEWLGAFNLGCNIPDEPGYSTTYHTPDNCIQVGQVASFEAVGLITNRRMLKLFSELVNYRSKLQDSTWMALSVNGFEDSIVDVRYREHFFYSSGDNHYTCFINNQNEYLFSYYVCTARKPKRTFKSKKRKRQCNNKQDAY